MLNIEELKDLLLIVDDELIQRPYFRLGQSFWNNLITYYPEFERTRGTQIDCFHRNDILPLLINEICDKEAIEYFKSLNKVK